MSVSVLDLNGKQISPFSFLPFLCISVSPSFSVRVHVSLGFYLVLLQSLVWAKTVWNIVNGIIKLKDIEEQTIINVDLQ